MRERVSDTQREIGRERITKRRESFFTLNNLMMTQKTFETHTHTYLPTRSGNFIDNISKNDILIIAFHANFLPLNILAQPNVVTVKWMTNTASIARLALLKNNAGRHLFAHSIARRLIKGGSVFVALQRFESFLSCLKIFFKNN